MDLIEKYLDYVAPLKGSPRFNTFAFLSVINALLERRCWLDRGRIGIIFPNTYTWLIGPPATGKSTSADLATAFMHKIATRGLVTKPPHLGPSKITQAALYRELADAERVYSVVGQGNLKQSPLFLYASELSRSMDDFGGGTLTSELIDFYDSKQHNHVIKKRTITDQTVLFHNPSITFLGCTTQDYMARAASSNIVTSGLSSRIILVVEPNRVEKERDHIALDPHAEKDIASQLSDIFALKGAFVLDKDAYQLLKSISIACDDASFNATGPLMQNYFGRKPDHITKLAMAFAASSLTLNITSDHITKAAFMMNSVEKDIGTAFGIRDITNDSDASEQYLIRIPRAPKCITRTALLQCLRDEGKFVSMSVQWEDTVKGLVNTGKITAQQTDKDFIYSRIS